MTDLFDQVETGSPEGPNKPAGIRAVLERFRLLPAEAVYVGDAPSDIAAARSVGLTALGAAWMPGADPAALRPLQPAAIFDSVAGLRDDLTRRLTENDA